MTLKNPFRILQQTQVSICPSADSSNGESTGVQMDYAAIMARAGQRDAHPRSVTSAVTVNRMPFGMGDRRD